MNTIGKRIAEARKAKNINQNELAEILCVSPQAVSKWENDISCPDISLLPSLAKTLGISVDELLSGKQESVVSYVPEEARKSLDDMMLKIVVDSSDGDKVRVNVPCALAKIALECGMEMPQISGSDSLNSALKNIDLAKIFEMVEKGAMGNLVEVESHDGDIISIFVE
ncbi:MAG: helix-turn-helix transcriptional regulator [Oscillospiraceae bacterium]|nr:helix-turn-helix transcriptional regulator [Oscillospiraceae bacterium]MBQ3237244.1 helix-turn-helix transcriptional regulator [Oscillospiraceae bacterium]MBQ6801595.1 helix-turn-helix transcriptional regulator [Oscillospiraceae bacterium]